MAGFAKRARRVRLAVFDVDGVFNDGTLYYAMDGRELVKTFNILDGHGVKMLQAAGVKTAIITGRKSGAVAMRARELDMGDVIQGAGDKAKALSRLLRKHRLEAAECSYMGDDLPDLGVMAMCGLAAAPANAVAAVRRRVHLVTRATGGRGAVREFCERVLEALGRGDIVAGEAAVK